MARTTAAATVTSAVTIVALATAVFFGPVAALTLGLAGIVIISALHEAGHPLPAGHSGARGEQFADGMLRGRCALTTDHTQYAVNAAPVGGSCEPVPIGAVPAVPGAHLTGPSAPPPIRARVPGLGSRRPRLPVRRGPDGITQKGAAIE